MAWLSGNCTVYNKDIEVEDLIYAYENKDVGILKVFHETLKHLLVISEKPLFWIIKAAHKSSMYGCS